MGRETDSIPILNSNGGLYAQGKQYTHSKKLEVANIYLKLFVESEKYYIPTIKMVALKARVSESYARKVIIEIMTVGDVIDPEMISYINKRKRKHRTKKLSPEHSRFILALYKKAPERPNFS